MLDIYIANLIVAADDLQNGTYASMKALHTPPAPKELTLLQ